MDFGPDLTASVDLRQDGSFTDLFFAQFRQPSLVPVLEAVLSPGDTFYDVGANIGIYSVWAARLVGPTGAVRAFEPVPTTTEWLRRLVAANGIENVEIIAVAVSDSSGRVSMQAVPGASGLSRVVSEAEEVDRPETQLTAESVTLDQFHGLGPPPTLVKIDVEGAEPRVLAGMAELLGSVRPVVVFESPDYGGGAGVDRAVALLTDKGYEVFSLTPRGLRAFEVGSHSHNLLALHPASHARERDRLSSARFPRNQNC